MILIGLGRPTVAESQYKTRVLRYRGKGNLASCQSIPEYLDPPEIEALLANAPHTDCELAMHLHWGAGLSLSEAWLDYATVLRSLSEQSKERQFVQTLAPTKKGPSYGTMSSPLVVVTLIIFEFSS